MKVIKQAAELDKIDPDEEKKDDKEDDDEAEEVMSLHEVTFVLGAVHEIPLGMNEFIRDSNSSAWPPQHWERRSYVCP